MGSIYQDIYGSSGGDFFGGMIVFVALLIGIPLGLVCTLGHLKRQWTEGHRRFAVGALVLLAGGFWFWFAMYKMMTGGGAPWAIAALVGALGPIPVASRLMDKAKPPAE